MNKRSSNINSSFCDVIFVALSLSRIPMLAVIIEFCVLMFIPQSQEILFGLQSPILELSFNASNRQLADWMNFVFFVISIILLALSVWYCSRLLCTVHQFKVMPHDILKKRQLPSSMICAITWVPRYLGTISISLAVGSLLMAGVKQQMVVQSSMAVCFLIPPALAVYAQILLNFHARPKLATSITAAMLMITSILVLTLKIHVGAELWNLCFDILLFLYMAWSWNRKSWPYALFLGASITLFNTGLILWVAADIPIAALQPLAIFSVTALLPALFHIFVVKRMAWLDWLNQHMPKWFQPVDLLVRTKSRTLKQVKTVLLIGAMISAAMLLLLSNEQHWLRSSATVLMLFLSSLNFVLTTVALVGRRCLRWRPGLVWAPVLLIVAFLANNRESIGEEELRATSDEAFPLPSSRPTELIDPAHGVVVNAHGGGLRAAYFTAQVLARLDDFSCGRFGENLAMTSGVSGGSLGLATYLLARQHLMNHRDALAKVGWTTCTQENFAEFRLSHLVDSLLLNDYLSGVMGTMLTSDLLPGKAHRGQTLLNSWQRPYSEKLQSGISLALPLSKVISGRSHIDSFFNATDARTGEVVTFSSRDTLTSHLPIGLAVLHSARFPVVSPAGRWQPEGAPERLLVDGGYSDNSGAAQLSRAVSKEHFGIWLNIDGNPMESECATPAARPAILRNWTGADALFASRRQRSGEAVRQMQVRADEVGAKKRSITLSMAEAYNSLKTVEDKCNAARHHRTAPLGWYMSGATASDIRQAAQAAALNTCRELNGLCWVSKAEEASSRTSGY